MPVVTAERLKEKAVALRKSLVEKQAKMDGVKIRAMKKRIRRAQRKARRLVAEAKRKAAPAETKQA